MSSNYVFGAHIAIAAKGIVDGPSDFPGTWENSAPDFTAASLFATWRGEQNEYSEGVAGVDPLPSDLPADDPEHDGISNFPLDMGSVTMAEVTAAIHWFTYNCFEEDDVFDIAENALNQIAQALGFPDGDHADFWAWHKENPSQYGHFVNLNDYPKRDVKPEEMVFFDEGVK